jgi:Bacteriophage tail sheath protein
VINGDPEIEDYIERLRAGLSILARVRDLRRDLTKACARVAYTAGPVNLKEGSDGDARSLLPRHFTGYMDGDYFRQQGSESEGMLFGLAAYEAVEEIGLVAIPDLVIPDLYNTLRSPDQIPEQGIVFADIPKVRPGFTSLKTGQGDMLFHCQKMGERFAILDSPRASEIAKGENRIDEWPNSLQLLPGSKYGALYYPWIRQKAADFAGLELLIPPCGHVTGVYSRAEQDRGVGKAPANEILEGAVEFEFCLSDDDQAILNPRSVNCLRFFHGRGLRVWGARTLSLDPLSIYVNVRRVALAIIKNIYLNLRSTVFEPNGPELRKRIATTLNRFFRTLFESGALAGATPEEAFFVKCDEQNNPPEIVDLGQVIAEIGFAPARPAEFILVTIKRSPGALSVVEP